MKSPKYDLLIKEIDSIYKNGQADSLLQKLEFEFQFKSEIEVANFILILLILMERQYTFPASSELLIRKIFVQNPPIAFLNSNKTTFEIVKENKVFPYVGLSEIIRRFIATVIYKKPHDTSFIEMLPSREYLVDFNYNLLESYIHFADNPDDSVQNGITLLYNSIENIDANSSKIELNSKALEAFKIYLYTNEIAAISYLQRYIRFKWYGGGREWFEGKQIVPEPFYRSIFKSSEGFFDFLTHCEMKFDSDDVVTLVQELREFAKAYEKNELVTYDQVGLTMRYHENLFRDLGDIDTRKFLFK